MPWDIFANLTKDNWERFKEIITGDNPHYVSMRAAIRMTGITKRELDAWIRRSRERNPRDPEWYYEIAPTIDYANEQVVQSLEDRLWDRVVNGVQEDVWHQGKKVGVRRKQDNNTLLRLLAARDDRYRTTPRSKHTQHLSLIHI